MEMLVRRLTEMEDTLKGAVLLATAQKTEEKSATDGRFATDRTLAQDLNKVEIPSPAAVRPESKAAQLTPKYVTATALISSTNQTRYDTLMRFTMVELEGSLKLN